jgi:group I intron endonuclease
MLSELAKNRVHSDLTKYLISKALIGENNPFYNKTQSLDSNLRMIEANRAYPVYVYDSYRVLQVIFPSVKTLAKLIKSNHPTIVNCIKNQVLFRGELAKIYIYIYFCGIFLIYLLICLMCL